MQVEKMPEEIDELLPAVSTFHRINCSICNFKKEWEQRGVIHTRMSAAELFYSDGWRRESGLIRCPSCAQE